jgi:hypothetical protein
LQHFADFLFELSISQVLVRLNDDQNERAIKKRRTSMTGQKITPFLWFHNQADEAATFYVGVFPNSKIHKTVCYGAAGPGPPGPAN